MHRTLRPKPATCSSSSPSPTSAHRYSQPSEACSVLSSFSKMTLDSEPCWSYPDNAGTVPSNSVTFTTVPFPVSPISIDQPRPSSPRPAYMQKASELPAPTSHRSRNRRHNAKAPTATSSSLPNPKELSIEDDWTRVKCPKEKKRIQNRVAQRTYRHRMKARLGELQARLDNHERQRIQHVANSTNEVTADVLGASANLDHNGPIPTSVGTVNSIDGMNSLLTTQRVGETTSTRLINDQRRSTVPVLQGKSGRGHERAMEDAEPAFYSHNAQYLHSPPNSHPSPQAPNGLLSPPGGHPDLARPNRVSQDFVLDCLRFQTQLSNRLGTIDPDAPFPIQTHYSPPDSAVAPVMDSLGPDHVGCMGSFTQAHVQSLDFTFDSSRDDWRTDAFDLKTRSSISPIDQMSFPQIPDSAVPTLEPMLDSAVIARSSKVSLTPQGGSRNEEMVESVMRHAHNSGFDTLEDLATAYYTTSFRNSSPLATEQHLSRSKRLPRAVSDIYQATETWPQWERCGFRQEILKTAASMSRLEAAAKQSQLASSLFGTDASESLETMKRTIQQEMPNAWALNQALVDEASLGPSTNSSDIALVAIVLQQFSGQLPRKQLLRVLDACL